MDLQALSDFDLVAAHGGFGRAARVAGRSKATLSRRVAELEQSLGVRLIERGSHSLRLTDEGRALHERTRGLLSEIAEAGEAVVLGASTPKAGYGSVHRSSSRMSRCPGSARGLFWPIRRSSSKSLPRTARSIRSRMVTI